MELFPNLEFGLFNGWILIVLFFVAYVIMLIFFVSMDPEFLTLRSGHANPIMMLWRDFVE